MIRFSFRKKLLAATVGSVFMALASAVPSMAASVNYTGTTAGQPTWNRPLANRANPPVNLSASGTNVPYSSQIFNVSTAGSYNFLSESVSPVNWDNFLFLYQNSFNPATPLANAIIGNDDFPITGRSGFNNVSLTAGLNYFLVTTGFSNNNSGSFRNTISGPGNISLSATPVPEPLTILGSVTAAGFGAAMRRKQKQQQKATAKVG